MSQPQKQTNVEPIFEKKGTNKYDGKAFNPKLSELIKQVVSESKTETLKEDEIEIAEAEKLNLAKELENLSDEQAAKVLVKFDPRNNLEYFLESYENWARDNSNTHTHLASLGSKVSYWIGSTFVANPASIGVPDYIWYLPKDRMTCFRGHFDPKRIGTITVSRYILFTNRYIDLLRDKILKRIGFIFLATALVVGGATYTVSKGLSGYKYVVAKVKSSGDKEKFKEEQMSALKKEAEDLVAKYKEQQVSETQFREQVKALKDREQQIKEQ
jgi:hypothetical protein